MFPQASEVWEGREFRTRTRPFPGERSIGHGREALNTNKSLLWARLKCGVNL